MAAQYVPFGYYDKISIAEMWKLPCGYFISIVNYAVWNAETNIRILSSLSVQESFQRKLQFKFWTDFFTSIIFVIL